MSQSRIRIHIRYSNQDIISNLPCDVINSILRYLPIEDAVATSILSRKWRYKWTTKPELIFDDDSQIFLRKENAEDVINHILLHHHGFISKFILRMYFLKFFPNFDLVNQWILLLSKHTIHEFELSICWEVDYVVPASLFAFQHLRDLTLLDCVFEPPLRSNGLKKLVNLTLKWVKFKTAAFQTFISQCPLLEEMSLLCCTDFDNLEINAPSLKYLEFNGNFTSISFRKSSNLAKLEVCPIEDSMGRNDLYSNLVKAICALPALEELLLTGFMLEFLAGGRVPKQLPTTMKHLKFLHLHIDFSNVGEVLCALFFIKSSPNLQNLHIASFTELARYNEEDMELLGAHITSKCPLNNLKNLFLRGVSGVQFEKRFIKYLLASAPVLQEIELKLERSSFKDFDGQRDIVKELKQYPGASLRIALTN